MASAVVALVTLGAGCGSDERARSPGDADGARADLVLTMSMYLVSGADSGLGSRRTLSDLESIAAGMNEVWEPAGIRIDAEVFPLTVPPEVLVDLARGSARAFYEHLGESFELPRLSDVHGLYVPSLGRANGVADTRRRLFFVIDEPTVFDRRVSAHEVGHLLGLEHDLADPGRLMFSGTNGMALTADEISTARAQVAAIIAIRRRGIPGLLGVGATPEPTRILRRRHCPNTASAVRPTLG